MKTSAIIFDLDGTLADCSHRRHYVESKPKNWNAFYAGVKEDKPNELVNWFWHICHEYKRLIITGRPERIRTETESWLSYHIYPYILKSDIYMRPDGDHCPDDELKLRIYREQIEPNYDVKLALDDRDKVVKMWRSLGLECWQVAEGNF